MHCGAKATTSLSLFRTSQAELLATRTQAHEPDPTPREDQLDAALTRLRTGLAIFGPGGVLVFANRRFTELFGLAEPPRVGVRFAALLDGMATQAEFTELDGSAFIAEDWGEAAATGPGWATRAI